MKFKKNDRVEMVIPNKGKVLGVVSSVSTAKQQTTVVPDGGWESPTRYSVYTIGTIEEVPGHIEVTNESLPEDCMPFEDDPVKLAGFTAKITGVCEAHDGHAYNLIVLRYGRKTGIQINEGGHGGMIDYSTFKADPGVVADFEAACDAWNEHYQVVGPYVGSPIHSYDVWQGHQFAMSAIPNIKNFPIRRFTLPERWDFTWRKDEGDDVPFYLENRK